MLRLLILALLASLAQMAVASDTPSGAGDDTSGPSMLVIIKGEIQPGETEAIKRDIASNLDAPPENYGQRLFALAATGGDSEEAMRIGRYIRSIKGTVLVPETGRCYSACVFILAGGTERIIEGPVAINWPDFGLHGPKPQPRERSESMALASAYLEEMGVPSSLVDEMSMIPPSELLLLSDSELRLYFPK